MLAYVFWHWPRPLVSTNEYEASLVGFHRSLTTDPPPGFRQSLTFHVDSLPWHNDKAEAYEDWYLVADSAALDPLNAAAVSGNNRTPHDRAAQSAAGGIARSPNARSINRSPSVVWRQTQEPSAYREAGVATWQPFGHARSGHCNTSSQSGSSRRTNQSAVAMSASSPSSLSRSTASSSVISPLPPPSILLSHFHPASIRAVFRIPIPYFATDRSSDGMGWKDRSL